MFNLVVVRNKNGDIRLCVDFMNLNQLSLKDNYTLPIMENLLQRVIGVGMISMLDGFSNYNQVLVKREDQLKTTFTTPWGTFMCLRIPFGLMNVGSTFQRAMEFSFRNMCSRVTLRVVGNVLKNFLAYFLRFFPHPDR
jgi:hypothetical protein